MMRETHTKTLIKTLSWRCCGTATTWFVAFYLTGDTSLSTKFSAIELVGKSAFYYLHERLWQSRLMRGFRNSMTTNEETAPTR
jgi:uncharacterized membrane protein